MFRNIAIALIAGSFLAAPALAETLSGANPPNKPNQAAPQQNPSSDNQDKDKNKDKEKAEKSPDKAADADKKNADKSAAAKPHGNKVAQKHRRNHTGAAMGRSPQHVAGRAGHGRMARGRGPMHAYGRAARVRRHARG